MGSEMCIRDSARAIVPSATGDASALPASISAGQTFNLTYSVPLSSGWNLANANVVAILIAPDGSIDNGGVGSISAPGFGIGEDKVTTSLHPNPANDYSILQLNLDGNSDVKVEVFNMNGQRVMFKEYGSLQGVMNLPINTQNLSSGLYLINLYVGNETIQHKLSVD